MRLLPIRSIGDIQSNDSLPYGYDPHRLNGRYFLLLCTLLFNIRPFSVRNERGVVDQASGSQTRDFRYLVVFGNGPNVPILSCNVLADNIYGKLVSLRLVLRDLEL